MAQSRTTSRLIVRETLKAFAAATAISMVFVAPNTAVFLDQYMKKADKFKAKRTISYLKYRKLVEVKVINNEYHYRLTSKGMTRYKKMSLDDLKIKTPRNWDQKWRLVMFDIPAIKQEHRKLLLHYLRTLYFYKLQDSAWIHPFNCETEVGILIEYLRLEKHVSFLVIDKGNFTDHAFSHFKKAGLLV